MIRLLLALLIACSALTSPARGDDAEDKAIAFVEKHGGKITRDDKQPGKPVVGVNLFQTQLSGMGLKELAPLKNLTTIELHGVRVTPAGLKELAPLKNLMKLNLSYTGVTAAGLKELTPLKNLNFLILLFPFLDLP